VVADTRSAPAAAAQVNAKRLAPGDELRLKLVAGGVVLLRLAAFEPDALVGTATKEGTLLRVPTAQIETIEREDRDWLKTGLLIAAILALVALVGQSTDVSVPRVD